MRIRKEEKKQNSCIVPILVFVAVMLIFSIGYIIGRTGFEAAWENGEFNYTIKGSLYPEERDINFDLFWEVWDMLEETYVDKTLDEMDMFNGAIKGMVSSLNDPATIYLTSEDTTEYETERSGKFEGIGIEMGYSDSQIIIKKIFADSPAEQSELEAGDIIKQVDGEDISEIGISDVAKRIRGESGTNVVLTIQRNGGEKEIEITRGEVYVASIDWETLENDVVLVTVRRFTESNFTDFALLWDEKIAEIEASNPKGIIIDIRGNGGGYLDGAPYLAGEFLEKGDVVLYVQDREGTKEAQKVERVGKFSDIPLIILVDGGTASSAEIFAGALQYYERATIIGEETYGKGTAQEVIKPASWGGASIHVTTQKWLLPDQRWINHDSPIIPDIEVEITVDEIRQGADPQLDRAEEEIVNRQ